MKIVIMRGQQMEKFSDDMLRKLTCDKLRDSEKIGNMLRLANLRISKGLQEKSEITESECKAYFQLIYYTERERISLLEKKADSKLLKENSKKCVDLYKKALSRNPSDEQLQFIYEASIYAQQYNTMEHEPNFSNLGCLNILKDSDIGKGSTLSNKVINAMLQHEQSRDNTDSVQNCDVDMVLALLDKNFDLNTLISFPDFMSSPSKMKMHPSIQRGIYLFDKLSLCAKDNCAVASMAKERLNSTLQDGTMETLFEQSPNLATAYANFEQTYISAYLHRAENEIKRSKLHKALEAGDSQQQNTSNRSNVFKKNGNQL